MFKPCAELHIPENSALFTIGALEQLGENYGEFLNFILKNKFQICVHLETSYELYEEEKLLDALAKRYLEKRNWLRGYFARLKNEESEGALKILYQRRTFGSLFHDGYTITVWKKTNV
jgi:hypothetical protein